MRPRPAVPVLAVVLAVVSATALSGCLEPRLFDRCRDAPSYDGGPTGAVCVGGALRTFLVSLPEGDGPHPLLLALHGGAGDAQNMRDKTHLDAAAGPAGVVVVYPQGTPTVRGGDLRTWNAAHCCGRAWAVGSDDVAFLDAVLDAVASAVPVDEERVGVAGHSNGAMMAHRYAAERPDRVCCVVSVAGTVGGASPPGSEVLRPPTPAGPVDVLFVHATDDPRVPFEGGEGENLGQQRSDLPVADSVAFWESAGGRVDLVTTTGGHGWPGGEGTVTPAPASPDASRLAVDWLLAHDT